MCAEHALPIGWENMDYDTFLAERRNRMADLVRVAFRKLGGESDAAPVTPPWFLPGAEKVWARISQTERALRRLVKELYRAKYAEEAEAKIEALLSDAERSVLTRALRSRGSAVEALSLVDYLYLAQLPRLLFASPIWEEARKRFEASMEARARLQSAIDQIAPVRNEIAHVRDVDRDRLLRADLACNEILNMIQS